MFLKRFTRPKWQNPDPEIRRQALGELDKNDPALAEIVVSDPDAAIRSAAICACGQLDPVVKAWRSDSDAGVRNTALKRVGLLVSTQSGSELDMDRRVSLIGEIDDIEVLAHIVRQAQAVEIRRAALSRLDNEEALEHVATHDENADLRQVALERIRSEKRLKAIARHWRGRDKRLHRRARELAEQIEAEQQRPARLARLCEGMEAIADGEATLSHDAIANLCDEWRQLTDGGVNAESRRFEAARARAMQQLDAQQAQRQQIHKLRAICKRLDEESARLHDQHQLDEPAAEALEQRLQAIRNEWREADAEHVAPLDLADRFQRGLQRLIGYRDELFQNQQRRQAAEKVLERGAQLLADKRLSHSDMDRWREQWAQVSLPSDKQLAGDLRARAAELTQRLQARADTLKRERENTAAKLFEDTEALGELLRQGQLQPAIKLFNRIRRSLDGMGPLPGARQRQMDRQLHQADQRIRELRGWRRWGSNHVREELIEAAQALTESELPAPALAERIRALRNEWQGLDKSDSATNEKLWEQFDQLCTQAYEPCKAYYEQLGEERSAHVQARRELIDALDRHYREIDWEQPDWRAVDRYLNQARRQWRDAPDVRGKDRRVLEEKHRVALERYEAHLGPERDRNREQRRAWIEQAAALVELEDMRAAIEQAKRLQQQWHITVAARHRRDDQKLWHGFRKHIDAVFARRDSAANEEKQQREAAATAFEAVCATLEAAAQGDQDSGLRQALLDARSARKSIGPLPRNAERALDDRFNAALRAVQQRLDALHRQQELDALDRLLAFAQAQARFDAQVLAGETEQAASEFEQAIATLTAAPPDFAEALAARRVAALDIGESTDDVAQIMAGNHRQLLELALRLEILCGLESPPEFSRERLALQVDRLSEAMLASDSGESDRVAQFEQLVRQWLLTGPVDADSMGPLAERLQRVRASLDPE